MSDAVITLPEVLTVKHIADTRARFDAALAETAGNVCIAQCGAVARVDALGVQLLLAVHRTLAARDGCLVLAEDTGVIAAAAEILGLQAELEFAA